MVCIVVVVDIVFMLRAFLGGLTCFFPSAAPHYLFMDVSGMGTSAHFFECQRPEPSFGRKKSKRISFEINASAKS